MTTNFNILKEDLSKEQIPNVLEYTNSQGCPFWNAFFRQFPEFSEDKENIAVNIDEVYYKDDADNIIAILSKKFGFYIEYRNLREKGEEFFTTITFLKNKQDETTI